MAAVIGALRVNLGLNSAEFETGMKKASGAIAGISKAFAALGGVAIFAGLTAGIGQAVGRIEETRKLTVQLDKALTNVGNTARTSGKEVSDFADNLERSTGRAAEEVLAVSTNLATFGFSREVFFDAIKLADDMSAAWGGDLKQNVEGLARALADPEKGLAMLTKRGITFTDQQKEMIAGFLKANDLIGAQGVVMDALNEQVKGVAESGFSGLTKAQANATLAMESFFETIANAMGVNTGLEMSLVAVAAALDFVSQNFDVIARAAGVAGAALLTALGPAIWATITAAASAMSTSVVAGIRAIGVAIAANPIGLIAVALAAAITAAILFRDEIKKVIGIDFVGVVIDAANKTIGAFVGAYEAVKEQWNNLPTFFSAIGKKAWNSFLESFEGPALTIDTPWGSWESGGFDLSGAKAKLSEAEEASFNKSVSTFSGALNTNYFHSFGEALGFIGDEAGTAASQIAGLGAALDGGGGAGGATGGAQNLGSASDETKDKLSSLGDMGRSVASTLASGFKDIFKAVITGSGNAMDAVSGLLGKLGDLFLDNAFNMLLGGLFGGGGGQWGVMGGFAGFKGMFGLPSFDGGGFTGPGRGPGLDGKGGFLAMLHPNETVLDHSKGQGVGPTIQISISGSRQDAAEIAREVRRVLPDAIASVNRNPYRRT